jgi:hypothetical protein
MANPRHPLLLGRRWLMADPNPTAQLSLLAPMWWGIFAGDTNTFNFIKKLNLNISMRCIGAPERIRTSDPLIRSQVLYPAELRVH